MLVVHEWAMMVLDFDTWTLWLWRNSSMRVEIGGRRRDGARKWEWERAPLQQSRCNGKTSVVEGRRARAED